MAFWAFFALAVVVFVSSFAVRQPRYDATDASEASGRMGEVSGGVETAHQLA